MDCIELPDSNSNPDRRWTDQRGFIQLLHMKTRLSETIRSAIRTVFWLLYIVCDFSYCIIPRIMVFFYWNATGKLPPFFAKYTTGDRVRLLMLEEGFGRVDELELIIDEMTIDIANIELEKHDALRRVNELQETVDKMTKETFELKSDIDRIEQEKQDALRRLSELASVRLRDNNPNIVDLNDQDRPSKLSEMFSELYDNEWTSAYSNLVTLCGERQAIGILLDVILSVYKFCEKKVEVPWSLMMQWCLDMSLPDAQKTLKWLKDSRKQKIRSNVQEVSQEYQALFAGKLKGDQFSQWLSHRDTQTYITNCVEVCLLMATTDPPVLPSCPGWVSVLSNPDKESVDTVNNRARDTDMKQTEENRMPFDTNHFKEYTSRGYYLQYFVWPALFLHKDGPLLSKGIAQGQN